MQRLCVADALDYYFYGHAPSVGDFAAPPIKMWSLGTSLVVQWLRLHAPNVRIQVQSLVRKLDLTCGN